MSDSVAARLESVVERLEAALSRLNAGGAGAGAGAAAGGNEQKIPAQVVAYDAFYATYVQPLVDTCSKISGVEEVGKGYETAFKTQRSLFYAAAECKKPAQNDLMKFVDPIVQVVTKAQSCDNRNPMFSHLKTFSETIQLMNWIFQPGPVTVIKATLEAADFYLIKILTFAKDAPNEEDKKNHRAYVSQTKDLINHFADFVKEHYLTGIVWNPKGKALSEFNPNGAPAAAGVPAAPAVPAGVPPPPPVDPNFHLTLGDAPAAKPAVGGLGAVFAEINNKGEGGVTFGLKKVTSDMKTKNMKDAPVLAPKSSGSAAAPAAAAAPKVDEKKASSLTLKQGTWFCEFYENTQVEVPDVEMKQSVYIYKAKNAVITIPNKTKSIQIDNCTKTTVIFNSVVSTFEVVNCKGVTIQVQEQCPSVTIDKTAGCAVILTESSYKNPPTIVISLTSELNVVVPGATPEDDPIEMPVPQQYITSFKNGQLVTEALVHKG